MTCPYSEVDSTQIVHDIFIGMTSNYKEKINHKAVCDIKEQYTKRSYHNGVNTVLRIETFLRKFVFSEQPA